MITRVTTSTLTMAAARNLQSSAATLARLQVQASTQRAIGQPSDNPAATADAMGVRAAQAAAAQQRRNIADGSEWLTRIDSALDSATSLLRRATDLTIQGANDGTMSPAAKNAIAAELDDIRAALLVEANTDYRGRSVFAGTSGAGFAFAPDFSFSGGLGTVERRVSETTTLRVDVDGDTVFGAGADSLFADLEAIAADLRAGVPVGPRIDQLGARMEAIVSARSAVGARMSALEAVDERHLDLGVALESRRASLEEIDIAAIISQLTAQEVAYRVALSVTARTLQPTLMDFLR